MVKHHKVLFDPRKQTFYHRNEEGKEPYIAPIYQIWMEVPTWP